MTKRSNWIAVAVASLALTALIGVAYGQASTQPAETFKPKPPQMNAAPATPGATPAATPGATPTATPGGTPGKDDGNQATQPAKPDLFGGPMIWIMLVAIIGLFWYSSRTRKKDAQKHRDMLAALKKGDKITTVGGIIGMVVEVREDEVVVKVDETNNVRMRFTRGAIRTVGEEGKAPEQK